MNTNFLSRISTIQVAWSVVFISFIMIGIYIFNHGFKDNMTSLKSWGLHAVGEEIILEWELDPNVKHISHFIVERSLNASSFEPIAQVDVIPDLGNSMFLHVDERPSPNTQYRIRIIMEDGTEMLSPVRETKDVIGLSDHIDI